MARMKNYKAGANRHWRAIASSERWAQRKPETNYIVGGLLPKDIKTAKDGRKYFLIDGKVNYIKGSKPTR
tara:strand:+ start:3061 stop:3270 length:210 start_codon:yes stop_codon:yes gene_type:complete